MEARHPFVVDCFSLLDHRTQARAVPQRLAPAGRYLSVEDGDELQLIALDSPIIHIGRGLAADVRIEDAHVSRRHAIIAHRAEGVRVLDDRSSNGTHVNGQPVTVSQLTDGDVLRVGRVAFRYVEVKPGSKRHPLRRIKLVPRGRRVEPVIVPAA
jgi:pSer/pThr/pTyr-binding forkhead associated (FHA) protein